ncbi:hypothetical protein [Helicobacter pylori]|uniref:hypothetical protein n=1 Tax=Helicobacter pylori TaxID=210 RepID=UPI0005747360|nr:hypothetical protein [Helicobacter pylori]ANT42587.1 hypothetical protein [Helicobacter phage Pt1846U]KHL81537.1 hypothetical protein HPY1846_06680 [Helicobacter pylori]MCQ2824549.1 V-type proton ATPase subunit E [Helicobacter pylori]
MAYFESITAGRGGLDSFNQALNNQRYANLNLNESMGNFANTIANAGSLFDNAKIKEEALKYQRMRDLANDKKQAEAFELQKRQAEQSMDLAKRQQVLNEKMYMQNKILNEHRAKALEIENKKNKQQQEWLMKANAKPIASVDNNNAMKMPTPTTMPTQNALNAQTTPKPKTITKEEFMALYAKPMSFKF